MLQPKACTTTFQESASTTSTFVFSFRKCWAQVKRQEGKKNRPESSNERKRTCSRIKSYFDPSVGSDWGSLMSICLAGISLAPGNPTGFLRIGEDSKVVRLELWRDTHSVAASTRVNTWWFCVCVSVCVGCVCEVQGSVSRCRQGQALGM